MGAYANAKLMVLMYPYELARRPEHTDVTVNAVQPGFVATSLGRNDGNRLSSITFRMVRPFWISAKKAAKTPVYLASSEEVKNATGKCFSKLKETATSPASYDQHMQKLLCDKTVELLGLANI